MNYYPLYFINSEVWADFWKQANPTNHEFFVVRSKSENIELQTIIYEFPWRFGEFFWYVSKGPGIVQVSTDITKKEVESELTKFWESLLVKAKKRGIIYLKIDFDDQWLELLHLKNKNEFYEWLTKHTHQLIKLDTKIIQYIGTMVFDLTKLKSTKGEDYADFMRNNNDFWLKRAKVVRNSTRRSLEQGFKVITQKSEENFQKFYTVYKQVSQKHSFPIQSSDYLHHLYNKDITTCFIVEDQNREMYSVWFGVKLHMVMYNLFGGTTQLGLDRKSQYFTNLVAIKIAKDADCKIYDFGGYNDLAGFGKFKDRYHGNIRLFIGPVDVVFDSLKYNFMHKLINLFKKIKR